MMKNSHRYLLWYALLRYAKGCTTVVVNATGGGTVIGRTMELGIPLPERASNEIWSLVARQRDDKRFGYAAISAALGGATSEAFVVEGMNEKGFTVSVQTLQQSVYENHTTPAPQPVTFDKVAAYLLKRCASVADVPAALRAVAVVDAPLFAKLFGRCHWSVADASGTSAVVEYLEGRLSIHDNSRIGVMTNDPYYEWHLHNLNGYAAYPTTRNQAPWGLSSVETAVGPVPSLHPGHGLNTRGLPGGTTPADRFVKMYLLREMAAAHAPPPTIDDAIVVAQGLLNTVHLVRGTIASLGGLDGLEWTNWAVVKVPAERRFLLRTYSDLAWRDVDLSKIDFAKAHAPRPLYDGLGTHRSFLPPALVTQ